MDKPRVCLSRHLWSGKVAERWFWKELPQRQHRPERMDASSNEESCLMIDRSTHIHRLQIITGKKWQHYMLYILLLWPMELWNYVDISTALALTRAALHSQEECTQRQEGAAPGRRGPSVPGQLVSAVGTSLHCTSTRSLAACSETNHVTRAFPQSIHLLNHPCLIPVFRFSMKPDLD